MTDAGTGRLAGRLPRWAVAALVGSLAVNLLVVGLIVGASWRVRGNTVVCRGPTPNLIGYAGTLPRDRREALWERTAQERLEVRPFRRDVRAAREEFISVLEVEPFDRQRFMAAQNKLSDAAGRAQTSVHTLYAEMAAQMTPDERRGFRRWREHLRPPGHNLLDEPDRQAVPGQR